MPTSKAEMKKWAKEHIKGVENTLFPSFDPGLKELDEAGIRLDVRQSIRHGFTSMMCATETGLTLDEARRFLEIAADEAGDDIIVTTSVILNSFEENMELVESAEKAGRHLKRVALELGGHNPLVILKDADIDYAVNAATFGAFLHQGQICMSVRRIIIESEIAGEFTEKFVNKVKTLKVGDPKDPGVLIGPIINQDQLETIKTNVENSVKEGAQILCGGGSEGPCYFPTVLANVKPQMTIACEETFGPVVSILEVNDMEEAVKAANETSYGLSSGVLTQSLEKGLWVAERIHSGIVHINDQSVHDEPQMPFGGVNDSGYGRLGGRAALEEFTELRWISFQRTPRQFPF